MGSCCQGVAVRQDIDIDIDIDIDLGLFCSRLPRKCSADDDLRLARRREAETLRALAREQRAKRAVDEEEARQTWPFCSACGTVLREA
jgi:hypothetical protein